MSDPRMPLSVWLDEFACGKFLSSNVHTQIRAGWYDWFCRDTSLAKKTEKLGPMVTRVAASSKIDIDKSYVFFKNNCPMNGPLYDDFRICDLDTGDVQYTVIPRSGHSGKAEVWGAENKFDGPIVKGTMRDVYKFFGV